MFGSTLCPASVLVNEVDVRHLFNLIGNLRGIMGGASSDISSFIKIDKMSGLRVGQAGIKRPDGRLCLSLFVDCNHFFLYISFATGIMEVYRQGTRAAKDPSMQSYSGPSPMVYSQPINIEYRRRKHTRWNWKENDKQTNKSEGK